MMVKDGKRKVPNDCQHNSSTPSLTPSLCYYVIYLVTVGWSVPSNTRRGLPPAHSSIQSSKPITVAPPLTRGYDHPTVILGGGG